jgi:KipI family sensor histidine kinase inhibitor
VTEFQIRYAGERALLVCPADEDDLAQLVARLRQAAVPGVEDLLPAAETVLVTLRGGTAAATVERALRDVLTDPSGPEWVAGDESEEVVIRVRYDGQDLDEVASLLDLTVEQLIEEHTSRSWRCRFIGFTAGFGYLESDRPGLEVPRRDESRTAVPPGAVALADGYSAVYPRRAPGGWQLIGTTDAVMWDLGRPRPALLAAGTRVRFVSEDG